MGSRRKWRGARRGFCSGACSKRAERSEEHTSELQSPCNLVCRLLLEKKKKNKNIKIKHNQNRFKRNSDTRKYTLHISYDQNSIEVIVTYNILVDKQNAKMSCSHCTMS